MISFGSGRGERSARGARPFFPLPGVRSNRVTEADQERPVEEQRGARELAEETA
jgi:hypothetical protein